MKNKKEFWISNISKKNVNLADLGFTIKAGKHYNLLDSKHFNFTLEQLLKSATSGSLFKKSKFIKIRKFAPYIDPPLQKEDASGGEQMRCFMIKNRTSQVVEGEDYFEELDGSYQEFMSGLEEDSNEFYDLDNDDET